MSRNKSPGNRKLRQFAQAYHAEKPPGWITIDLDDLDDLAVGTRDTREPASVGTRFCASAPGWQTTTLPPTTLRITHCALGIKNYALCITHYALRKIAA